VRPVRSRKLASQMVSRAPKGRSKVTNGRQLFIDGDARLKVSRRFRDVLACIAEDLGGVDRLSEGQKQIARRCAMLSVECEIMESVAVAGQPFDLDAYGQVTADGRHNSSCTHFGRRAEGGIASPLGSRKDGTLD
jgi:hypothetical protein